MHCPHPSPTQQRCTDQSSHSQHQGRSAVYGTEVCTPCRSCCVATQPALRCCAAVLTKGRRNQAPGVRGTSWAVPPGFGLNSPAIIAALSRFALATVGGFTRPMTRAERTRKSPVTHQKLRHPWRTDPPSTSVQPIARPLVRDLRFQVNNLLLHVGSALPRYEEVRPCGNDNER